MEGTARQATQREATFANNKKKEAEARRKYLKGQEISRWVCCGKRWEDVEAELESDDPTKSGDDTSSFEDKEEEDGVATATSAEHREPAAALVGGAHGTGAPSDASESGKHATGDNATLVREVKQARSSRCSMAPLTLHPPAPSVAEHVGRSGGTRLLTSTLGVGERARSLAEGCPAGCYDGFAMS